MNPIRSLPASFATAAIFDPRSYSTVTGSRGGEAATGDEHNLHDGAGRPLLVASRLSSLQVPGDVLGTAQYRYRVVPEQGDRFARFEALSPSPRCSASATWSDARGLKLAVFEDQQHFHTGPGKPGASTPSNPEPYQRGYDQTRGYCAPIDTIAGSWAAAVDQSAQAPGGQPARVSYAYDPLQQLTRVDSPLDGTERANITARFDLMGRTVQVQEPNSGCTRYTYDGLNLLTSEAAFRYEEDVDRACGASSKVNNEKTYTYSGDRLVQMSYRSLEEQGGPQDERDTVRFYYDRSPNAILFGSLLEALRFVPNDQANQRFVDVVGRKCDNCIGQAAVVSDRSGARAFSFNELGLPRREVRSIVAPRLREVVDSKGLSETYLPEVGFYELENSYTAFGDPVQEHFSESAPMNPGSACGGRGEYVPRAIQHWPQIRARRGDSPAFIQWHDPDQRRAG